jgi:hypothetical protein
MSFFLSQEWNCQFLEADLKTSLPRKIELSDKRKIMEIAERGGCKINLEGRQAIREGRGGVWLELSQEQYEKLKAPNPKRN